MNTVKVNNMSKSPSLRSQKGQMAIFLVLIFQVLFVFFAMTINVGLVVYDKINLQNATDMAAYYAAQKQAELLNQIGHVNYQVRQAYKLLTFRLRVIGSASIGLGNGSRLPPHPIFTAPQISQEEAAFTPGWGKKPAPAVCIGSSLWHEYAKTEGNNTISLCRDLAGFAKITLPSGTGAGPLGAPIQAAIDKVSANQELRCKTVGMMNWQLAASFLLGYRIEAEKRGEMLQKLADNMSQPAQSMLDFRGQSIMTGARNTLKKNLTDAQAGTLQMSMVNSLSSDVPGDCSKPDYWLPKVNIFPVVTYVKMFWTGTWCTNDVVPNRGGEASLPPASYRALIKGKNNDLLASVWTDGRSYPMGVEKNPWCMPYMGIKASTSPRKIFAPFGGATSLQVESYAKPFGGRIGPWYSRTWSPSSPFSDGTERIDPLIPSREGPTSGAADPANDVVNYSKYPGDKYGLNSRYALSAMNEFWKTKVIRGAPTSKLPQTFALAHYNHVGDMAYFESSPDSLVRSNGVNAPDASLIRAMEEAAVAPDLFDITYYSIEAQYSYNYFSPTDENFRSFVTPYYVDLGSQNREPYSLYDQIARANTVYGSNPPFYSVDDASQTLTSWAQNKATDFSFPTAVFGRCPMDRKDASIAEAPSPGGCPQGGRSGYSVKIVSKGYLNNVKAPLGNDGNEAPIHNPPGGNQ